MADKFLRHLSQTPISKNIDELLKSLVIYTEYDGVFLIPKFEINGKKIKYSTILHTIDNQIFKILKNSNELRIINPRSIKIENNIIENIDVIIFQNG